jgi:hypothetical protein
MAQLVLISIMSIRRENLPVVQRVAQEAVVAVIKSHWHAAFMAFFKVCAQLLITVNCLFSLTSLQAATLPPDTVDALYHEYDGGGMDINGPFILVRKSVGTDFSVNGHYYVDSVSAASIDVLATASPYEEKRTEYSVGVDYLHDKTMLSTGFISSSENDFEARNVFLSVNQSFFGDLTSLSMTFANGWDEVGKINSDFNEDVDRSIYKLGLSQVLTKNALLGVDLEMITDEGFLNNPYRRYRFEDENAARGFSYADEVYPETRTSSAMALRGLYYLPYRASLKAEYRYYTDSWEIDAHTFELAYVHPLTPRWTVEGRYRYYRQTQAEFFKDMFPFENAEKFMARDKELSSFSSFTLGGGVSYEFGQGLVPHIDRMKFTALLDYLNFTYDNFRDVTKSEFNPGEEPLYEFDAWVTRLSVTFEY